MIERIMDWLHKTPEYFIFGSVLMVLSFGCCSGIANALPSGSAVTANNTLHDNIAAEFAGVPEKVTPVSGDLLMIEDSADGNRKKRVTVGNLLAGAGGVHPATTVDEAIARYDGVTGDLQGGANTPTINDSGDMFFAGTNAPRIRNVDPSGLTPNYSPRKTNLTSGIGSAASGEVNIISNSTTRIHVTTSGVDFPAGNVSLTATNNHLVLPQFSDALTPTLGFGDGDTGWFESADDTIQLSLGGLSHLFMNSQWAFRSILSDGPGMLAVTATSTVPTVIPGRNDIDTGLGWAGFNIGSLVAGGVQTAQWTATGLTVFQHLDTSATSPTPSSCGTSPAVNGSDTAAIIDIGTGTVTSCTVTFDTAYADEPVCVVTGPTSSTNYAAVITTTTIVISSSANMAAEVVNYICFGLQ